MLKPGTSGEDEIEEMLRHVRAPFESDRRLWKLEFGDGQPTRRPGDVDKIPEEPAEIVELPLTESIITLHLSQPLTFGALVTSLRTAKGLDANTSLEQAVEAVGPLGLTGLGITTLLPMDRLIELEDKLGVRIEVQGARDAGAEQVPQSEIPAPRPPRDRPMRLPH